MSYFYSIKNKGFYVESVGYDKLPDDCILLSKEEYDYFLSKLNEPVERELILVKGKLKIVDVKQEITWDNIRSKRNKLLKESDYTQLPDFPEDKKSLWVDYRQQLRDITKNYKKPEKVIWPNKPNE